MPRAVGFGDQPLGFDCLDMSYVVDDADVDESRCGPKAKYQSSFDRGRPEVVAVGTMIPFGENGDPDGSIGLRTSLHRDFLIASARDAAARGHYPVTRWARDCGE